MQYDEVVKNTWRHVDCSMQDDIGRVKECIRYATLAPSGHNTQCWQFHIRKDFVSIFPDLQRRTPVVDPDDHHLYASLGCAAENLSLAARAFGFSGDIEFRAGGSGEIRVALGTCEAESSPLFEAILQRQCTRNDYDGITLSSGDLQLLEIAGTGREVSILMVTEPDDIEKVLSFVIQGNTLQMNNPVFRKELANWIRFNDDEAIARKDGLSARVTGNPQIPRWLAKFLLRAILRTKPENDKVARQIRSSSGIAIFVSAFNDRAHWVEAGRCYQRFALQATTLGVRNAFINQAVEEPVVRTEFARAMGLGAGRPDLVVRFGRAPEMPRSLRRPVEDVLGSGLAL